MCIRDRRKGDDARVVLEHGTAEIPVAEALADLLGRVHDAGFVAVSYTHLDVYKRQSLMSAAGPVWERTDCIMGKRP